MSHEMIGFELIADTMGYEMPGSLSPAPTRNLLDTAGRITSSANRQPGGLEGGSVLRSTSGWSGNRRCLAQSRQGEPRPGGHIVVPTNHSDTRAHVTSRKRPDSLPALPRRGVRAL